MSDKACESIMDVARNYTNLEYDVKRGSRGSRHDHVEKILTKITGAEAAMVVNNNAAATMLCLFRPGKRTRKLSTPGGSWWKSAVPSGCRKSWNRAAPS